MHEFAAGADLGLFRGGGGVVVRIFEKVEHFDEFFQVDEINFVSSLKSL